MHFTKVILPFLTAVAIAQNDNTNDNSNNSSIDNTDSDTHMMMRITSMVAGASNVSPSSFNLLQLRSKSVRINI